MYVRCFITQATLNTKEKYTYRSSVSWINLADVTAANIRDINNKTEVIYVFIISENINKNGVRKHAHMCV